MAPERHEKCGLEPGIAADGDAACTGDLFLGWFLGFVWLYTATCSSSDYCSVLKA
jgi:hypothetical protein